MNKETKKKAAGGKKAPVAQKNLKDDFPFTRDNYKWLIAGVVVLALGFILMSGGGTDDPTEFAGETLFSPRRMTVAPLLMLGGFLLVLYSIMKKTKEDESN